MSNHLSSKAQRWHLILLCIPLVLCIAYAQSLSEIFEEWTGNGPYSHGFLAFAIALWITWKKKTAFHKIQSTFNWYALLIILSGGLAWSMANLVNVQLIQLMSLPAIIFGTIVAIFGWQSFRVLSIPFIAFVLVLPIWNFLQVPLQIISAQVTYQGLRLINIPTLKEGFHFTVPGGQFIVEPACSGLGFFLTSCLLAILFIYFNQLRGVKGLGFFLFAIALAIVSNWIRILTIMIVGNYTQMDHIIVQDHLTFGWVIYCLMLIPFFLVGQYLTDPLTPGGANPGDQKASDHLIDNTTPDTPYYSPSRRTIATPLLALGFAVIFPCVNFVLANYSNNYPADLLEERIADKFKPVLQQHNLNWKTHYVGTHSQTIKRIQYNNKAFLYTVVRYDKQAQGSELIFYDNSIYARDKWHLSSQQQVKNTLDGNPISYTLLHLTNSMEQSRKLLFWYYIGGRITTNRYEAKVLELLGILSGNRAAYVFAVTTDSPINRAADLTDLEQIANTMQQQIVQFNPP